jgi:hypothetical protein
MLLAGIVAVGATGATIYWGGAWSGSANRPATAASASTVRATPSDQPVVYVSRNRRTSEFAPGSVVVDSIAKALARARPGDRVLLLDQFHEERLILAAGHGTPTNVTIESGHPSGKETVWQLPASIGDREPMLLLTDAPGIQFKNIIFDGERRPEYLVSINGRCPGLRLTNVVLRGFSRAAVRLGSEGTAAEPIRLTQLRIVAGTGAEAGFVFDDLKHLRISDSRLEGPFTAGAFQLRGPVRDAEIVHNRIYRSHAVIQLAKTSSRYSIQGQWTGNTACSLDSFLQVQALPTMSVASPSFLRVRGNLISQAKAMVTLDDPAVADELAQLLSNSDGNVRDRGTGDRGEKFLPAAIVDFDLPVDVNKDELFLRYPSASPLSKAGPDKGPVGVPPALPTR